MATEPKVATAGGGGGGAVTTFGWPTTTSNTWAQPNIVWQGTSSGSTYASANVALGR